jgi:hypothetical protein
MKNKKMTWSLVLLVVGIWGSIAYQLYASISLTDEDGSVSSGLPSEQRQEPASTFVYLRDVRDPFRYTTIARVNTARGSSHQTSRQVWVPPAVKLSGILTTGKRKIAMLEGSDGTVFFLGEGDTLRGVNLLKIKDQVVSYVYQKKKDEWSLPKH